MQLIVRMQTVLTSHSMAARPSPAPIDQYQQYAKYRMDEQHACMGSCESMQLDGSRYFVNTSNLFLCLYSISFSHVFCSISIGRISTSAFAQRLQHICRLHPLSGLAKQHIASLGGHSVGKYSTGTGCQVSNRRLQRRQSESGRVPCHGNEQTGALEGMFGPTGT
jgi:hypothetical protein